MRAVADITAMGHLLRNFPGQQDRITGSPKHWIILLHLGELLFHVFGASAQFERALISERVTAGLEAERSRGRVGGRPRAISSDKLEAILEAIDFGVSKASICRTFGVKRTTLIQTLARQGK